MKNLLKQAVKFVGLSGIGWILDFLTYTILGFISSNVVVNNIISSWIGVTFVFIFATRKVFQNQSQISLKWKYLIYLGYQVLLILLISKLLGQVNEFILVHNTIRIIGRFSTIISKILVTPITMVLNFIVMKSVIERL
ncbi:MAG: GtrA family protein [Lachnospiraceae bacterium]|nr:GtrA family protein [Lachnospiraceae bacterium]MBS4936357.1 GtrA family protein [Lachnospiraceae bacterium]